MRHLYGTALAVIMALVMFFAGAWGYSRLLRLPGPPGQPLAAGSVFGTGSSLLGLAAVIATAALAGFLVADRRLSPLAAGLPGVLLLAWTALCVISVRQAAALIPLRSESFGAGWEALLFNGVLGAAGAVLVGPAFFPSRWREPRAAPARAGEPEPGPRAGEPQPAVWPDEGSRQPQPRRPLARAPFDQGRGSQDPAAPQTGGVPALTGTVLSYPASSTVRPVDTTRITGASRALRATGSFQAVPGGAARSAGPAPRTAGSPPRTTGWFGTEPDGAPRGRRRHQSPDQ